MRSVKFNREPCEYYVAGSCYHYIPIPRGQAVSDSNSSPSNIPTNSVQMSKTLAFVADFPRKTVIFERNSFKGSIRYSTLHPSEILGNHLNSPYPSIEIYPHPQYFDVFLSKRFHVRSPDGFARLLPFEDNPEAIHEAFKKFLESEHSNPFYFHEDTKASRQREEYECEQRAFRSAQLENAARCAF